MDYEQPNDTPSLEDSGTSHLFVYESESVNGGDQWLHWVASVEKLTGIADLDGDQEVQGYSLDYAYAAFRAGHTAVQHASVIRHNMRTISAAARFASDSLESEAN